MAHLLPNGLTPPQQQIMDMGLLESGFNCVLQMSTGSGKTWLADRTIEKSLNSGLRAIYVCPTRALAAERYEHWRERHQGHQVGIFTGDFGKSGFAHPVSFSEARLLLMTPERLDSCTRNWRNHWDWIPETDLLVVDEFHLIGDGYRGARLEGALMRLRRLNPFLRIVALSATLGNREELAEWLDGVDYVASWRPVPLTWKYVRYKRAEEKPDLLVREIHRTTRNGGKSLVFTQSRRRAEALASHLKSNGFRACHHHAGLGYDTRRNIEHQFRGADIDIVVTTSTLEVGLNMPVRQVVLYDIQQFDGSTFEPLSITKVWQRIGRAGRFGLDSEGEAILLVPAWGGKSIDYEKAEFEHCVSSLGDPRAFAEQIIAELSSGLSRTRSELRTSFKESLATLQGRLLNIDTLIDEMCASGLIAEAQQSDVEEKEVRLKPTSTGRVAARHMLTPKTVLIFRKTLSCCAHATFFDLLLIACCSEDCDVLIPVSYEELPKLSGLLESEVSSLLSVQDVDPLQLFEIPPRRYLSALKMALAVRLWTRTGDLEKAAEKMECYPAEIRRLCESLERLLPAMTAIAELVGHTDQLSDQLTSITETTVKRLNLLQKMAEAGLNEEQVSLTLVPGIGKVWAAKLVKHGISDIEALAQASASDLVQVGGISVSRANQWIETASHVMKADDIYILRDLGGHIEQRLTAWPKSINPYRLRRALSLDVSVLDDCFSVVGGLDPHLVKVKNDHLLCDCPDFFNGHRCKHILAVQKYMGVKEVLAASQLIGKMERTAKLDLFQLWMSR